MNKQRIIKKILILSLAGLIIYSGFGLYNYLQFHKIKREIEAGNLVWQDGANKITYIGECITDTMCDHSGCKQCGISCPLTTKDYPAPYACAAYMEVDFPGQLGSTHISTPKGCPICRGGQPIVGGQLICGGTWWGNPTVCGVSGPAIGKIDRAINKVKDFFIASFKD